MAISNAGISRRCRRGWISPRQGGRALVGMAVVGAGLIAGLAGSELQASEGEWSVRLEAIQLDFKGHDQHVLNIHRLDSSAAPAQESIDAVTLETADGIAPRGEFLYRRQKWGAGIDFFWFSGAQDVAGGPLTGSASAAGEQVVFEIADRSYASGGPGESVFYDVLEDTDVNLWTVDLYASRVVAGDWDDGLRLQLGLRFGDFDNDYRAVVGLEGSGGTRLDASSNYGLMKGPLIGLAAVFRAGQSRIEASLSQSVMLGSVELLRTAREFTGPLSDAFPVDVEIPGTFSQTSFRTERDVAIPATEARLRWTYDLSRRISLGLGVHAAAFWDVPVPPGAVPAAGGETLHENTLVLTGLSGAVAVTF